MSRRDAGFTLLGLLVGLGSILAGLSQGTRFGLQAIGAQTRDIAGRGDLDAVDRTLQRLIELDGLDVEECPCSMTS